MMKKMKEGRKIFKLPRRTLSFLSLIPCTGMLFFTFFTWAWFSDANGIKFGFEIPIGTSFSTLSTLSDILWMIAPFLLFLSALWGAFETNARSFSLILSGAPLALYALLRVLLLLDGKESHGTLFIPLGACFLFGIFAVFSVFIPEARKTGALLALCYMGLEILLLILSMILKEKYSFFYFSQLIPLGHSSYFRYSFFTISTFFYYLFYALGLSLRFFSAIKRDAPPKREAPPKETDDSSEEEEEDLSSITLEDLGISR